MHASSLVVIILSLKLTSSFEVLTSSLVYPIIVDLHSNGSISNAKSILEYESHLNEKHRHLNVQFSLGNHTYLARLTLNTNLFSSNAVFQRKKTAPLNLNKNLCHFNGYVENVAESTVTVSLCNGMVC
jgi:hypothetical protein